MKRTSILILVLSLTLFALCSCASTEARETGADSGAVEGIAQIFPAENAGDSSYNTGESHLSVLKFSGNNMITSFRFEKGARNYWHSHPDAEQTLMILSGEAYYQEHQFPTFVERSPTKSSKIQSDIWKFATFQGSKTEAVFLRV